MDKIVGWATSLGGAYVLFRNSTIHKKKKEEEKTD
jgi:hypothetical protein